MPWVVVSTSEIVDWLCFFYREDLEKQEGGGVVVLMVENPQYIF